VRYFRDTLRATQIIVQAVLWYNPVKMFLLLSFMATGVSLAAALAAIWVHHHALVLLLLWASLMFPILILSLGSLGYIIRTAGLQNAPNAKPTADGCAPQTQSNIQRHA
jgi:hypothetical protein